MIDSRENRCTTLFRTRIIIDAPPSTTLALSIERSADLPAAVRASVGRSARQGGDDGFSYGRQCRLRRAGGDSFFPRSRRRGEDAGGRRRRSWASARGGERLALGGP